MKSAGMLRLFCFAAGLACSGAALAQQAPEFRALWVDTFHAAMRNSNEVSALVNTARGSNFNAIIVEVRKRGDAYYNSTLEPKASDVSPQTFDPLADLIDKAHHGGRRIEVHAWMTTYLAWNSQSVLPTQTNHPFLLHSNWLSLNNAGTNWDGANFQFDQGLPEVQKHVYNVAMDIVSRYDVDGLNFDYVRYSGKTWGYHTNTLDRFRRRYNFAGTPATTNAQWLQFRRDQISGLVRKVYLHALALKPQIKISADTICFAPGITDDAGWFASAAAWTDVLQDWRGWMREGILDLNVPMMYFRQPLNGADWAAWSIFAKEHAYGRQVALGQGSYLNTLTNVIYQLRTTRHTTVNSNATAAGMAIYSYAVPTSDTTAAAAFNALVQPTSYDPNPVPLFTNAVTTPEMVWKTTPTVGHLKGTVRSALTSNELDGATISISGPVAAGRTNDATGFYGFVHLPPGSYNVTASYSNLASQSATILITTGAVSTLDFSLGLSNAPLLNLRAWPGRTEALVAWTTTNASDSQVEFGLTPVLGESSWRDRAVATNHVVLLTGLLPNTNYFFRAVSRTASATNVSVVDSFPTAGDIIMDNGAASLAGGWTTANISADKYGADYVYASTTATAATATYTPNITTLGFYDLYVWYPQGGNRPTNAPFLLAFNGGTAAGVVNQTTGGGGWRLVATNKPFARGTGGYFQWQNTPAESGNVVMADAVKFTYSPGQEPPAPGQVPLWWGEFFFGGPVNAGLDPDTDGWTTAKEYVVGSDPLRAASRLDFHIEDHFSPVLRTSFAPFHSGRIYELEQEPVLGTNGWSATGLTAQSLPNGDGVFAVTNPPSVQKFYRLRVHLAP